MNFYAGSGFQLRVPCTPIAFITANVFGNIVVRATGLYAVRFSFAFDFSCGARATMETLDSVDKQLHVRAQGDAALVTP